MNKKVLTALAGKFWQGIQIAKSMMGIKESTRVLNLDSQSSFHGSTQKQTIGRKGFVHC